MIKVKRASGLAKADLRLGRERLGVGHVRIRLRRTAAAPHNNVERGAWGQRTLFVNRGSLIVEKPERLSFNV
jgi:hypothetical protein